MINPLADFSWQALHLLRPAWLGVLPLWWWFVLHIYRKPGSAAAWQRVCDPELLAYLMVGQAAQRRAVWWWLLVIGGSCLIFAMAGPTWKELAQPVYKQSSAVVMLLDVSRSMDAQDVKPSRLERAKQKLHDILAVRHEGQTALLVYAGEAFVVTPLTDDVATITAQLQSISTDMMPVQGSLPDKAIRKALSLLQQAGVPHGQLLLIGDELPASDNTAMREAITAVSQAGHFLSTLSIGSAQGAPIPLPGGGFVQDHLGHIVIPKLDPQPFAYWASQAAGQSLAMTLDDRDIRQLQSLWQRPAAARYQQAEAATFSHDQWREEGSLLIVLVLPLVALLFRRGWLVLLLAVMCIPRPASAFEWSQLWLNHDQQGQRLLQQDRYSEAAQVFDDPAWKAAAAYQAGDYEQAAKLLAPLSTAEANYNRGNALARLGKTDEAIAAYDACLKLQPDHADAAYNKRLLEQQKKEQQQKNSKQQKDSKQQKQEQSEHGSQNDSSQGDPSSQPSDAQPGQGKAEDSSASSPSGSSQSGTRKPQATPEDEKRAMAEQAKRDAEKQGKDGHAAASSPAEEKKDENKPQNSADVTALPPQAATPDDAESLKEREARQAYEQFIRRVPDDPGGLLRRKFLYQYQQQNPTPSSPPEQQPW